MDTRTFREILTEYTHLSAEKRDARFEQRLRVDPHCAISRYLAACHHFDRGRPAIAVRHLMVAHHAEPALESAALLVFAGLNWVTQNRRPLLDVLVETWDEFRRPQFDRTARERMLLDAFAQPADGLERVSRLAVALWRLPLNCVRTRLREIAARRDLVEHPLLFAPA